VPAKRESVEKLSTGYIIIPSDVIARYKNPDIDQYRIVTLNFSELFPEDHFLSRLLELVRMFDLSEFDHGYANDSSLYYFLDAAG